MTHSDHLPQPATEASRAVWAGVMNREVRERWAQPVDALWEKYYEDRRRLATLAHAITRRYGGQV